MFVFVLLLLLLSRRLDDSMAGQTKHRIEFSGKYMYSEYSLPLLLSITNEAFRRNCTIEQRTRRTDQTHMKSLIHCNTFTMHNRK